MDTFSSVSSLTVLKICVLWVKCYSADSGLKLLVCLFFLKSFAFFKKDVKCEITGCIELREFGLEVLPILIL